MAEHTPDLKTWELVLKASFEGKIVKPCEAEARLPSVSVAVIVMPLPEVDLKLMLDTLPLEAIVTPPLPAPPTCDAQPASE